MRKSQCSDEQIVGVVRESHAHGVAATAKKHTVSSHAIYLWRKKYGDMSRSQVSELKRIMQENARLKKLVAERDLEIEVMKEIASKQPTRSAAGRRTAASPSRHVRRSSRTWTTQGNGLARSIPFDGDLSAPTADQGRPGQEIHHCVVTQLPTRGKRLVYGWMREQGYDYSACTVYRVYRQSGYAAQWRTRSRTIRRGVRINPTAIQPHTVWCMGFAEDRLMTGQKMMTLLVKDEATSFGLSTTLRRSFKGLDVEAVLNELVAQHGTPKYIRSDNGGQFIATIVQQ